MITSHSDEMKKCPAGVVAKLINKKLPEFRFGSTLYVEEYPLTKNDCAVVMEFSSSRYNLLAQANRRAFNIQYRGLNIVEVRQKIWSIFDALCEHDVDEEVLFLNIDGVQYPYDMKDTPHRIGRDQQGRVVFAFTMYIITH